MSVGLHAQTPVLAVLEPRGLLVRTTAWYRSAEDQAPQARVQRVTYDRVGRQTISCDARLFGDPSAPANLSVVYSLSSQVLARDSVDAGWQINLSGEAGQPLESWDSRETHCRGEYDPSLRSLALFGAAKPALSASPTPPPMRRAISAGD